MCQICFTFVIMSSNETEIGSNLRKIRVVKGLTQAQLAEAISVSRQTINYIEAGTYCPSTKLALQLARILETTVEELFFLKEDKK